MKYSNQMDNALVRAMQTDEKVLVLGEGVTDPKGIFGTTAGVASQFQDRVMEIPLSENMITGACLGLALEGWKPILVHARCDLIMPAMEHMVNTVAKWRQVHRDRPYTLVIRAIIGRGWGQGPNHSQALHAMFAHIPGLRVLYPVNPNSVSFWLQDALSCGWPTLIMEPRRLYEVEDIDYPNWDQPDVYLVTFGDVVLDATLAAHQLSDIGIKAQVHPIEDVGAMSLPEGNTPVVVVDTGHLFCGASAEVMACLVEQGNTRIKRIGPPFTSLPTSLRLEQEWYPDIGQIIGAVESLLNIRVTIPQVAPTSDDSFKGPF